MAKTIEKVYIQKFLLQDYENKKQHNRESK